MLPLNLCSASRTSPSRAQRPFKPHLMAAFRGCQIGAGRRFRLGSFARSVPQPAFYQAIERVHTYVDAHMDKAIKQHGLLKQSLNDPGQEYDKHFLLHELLKLTADGQTVQNELMAVFFAGRGTTSAFLSNRFLVLAENPHIWQHRRDEVHQLQGRKRTLNELEALEYLGHCVNEGQVHTIIDPKITLMFSSYSTSALPCSPGIVACCTREIRSFRQVGELTKRPPSSFLLGL